MANILSSLLPKPRRELVTIHPDISLNQSCDIMVNNDIGALVVSDDINILGILSERDLVRNCLFKHGDGSQLKASDAMCSKISVLPVDATVEEAISTITTSKRRHILVEQNGEVIAILSQGDILMHMLATSQEKVDQLEKYIFSY